MKIDNRGIKAYFTRPAALLALVLSLTAAACAPIAVVDESFETRKPQMIAILPVQNESVDVDGPPVFRKLLEKEVTSRGYTIVSPDKVNEVLTIQFDVDPEQGGQVMAADPVELAKALGCDGLLYATVTEWEKHTAFYYNDVVVGGRFELLAGDNADRLWYVEHQKEKEVRTVNPQTLDWQSAVAATVGNMMVSYDELADRLITKVVRSLPPR